MSDHEVSPGDQTEEIMQDLLVAERHQEITQTTTMQGQIAALVMILKDAHVISQDEVHRWEAMSQEVGDLLYRISTSRDTRDSEADPESQLRALFDELDATIKFTRMMGTKEDVLEEMKNARDKIADDLKRLDHES